MIWYGVIWYYITYHNPPTPTAVERVETTLKYNYDNYCDYNYDSYSDYNYSLYWFTPLTPMGTHPPPLTLG